MLRTNKQIDKQTAPDGLPTPTGRVGVVIKLRYCQRSANCSGLEAVLLLDCMMARSSFSLFSARWSSSIYNRQQCTVQQNEWMSDRLVTLINNPDISFHSVSQSIRICLTCESKTVGGESVTHGQCEARPTVTFPATEHFRPLAVPIIYTVWWTKAHVCEQLALVIT